LCNPNYNQRRITIMISDVCEPCHPGGADHIDIQALAFQKVPCKFCALISSSCALLEQC
jgi:hypothetical protein